MFWYFTGTASVNIIGGVGPFNREWYNIDTTALKQGIYQVLITDFNGCKDSIEFLINQPDNISLNISTKCLCNEESNGTVNISINGGTTPYNENWFGIVTDSLSAGIYDYHVVDNLLLQRY